MQQTISCKGRLISLENPLVMGILNITPDSFFDGGKNNSIKNALKQTEKMLNEGTDIIDIGAVSTRPGAELISEEEELKRLIPIVNKIIKHFPEAILSIDTFRSNVAQNMIDSGAAIINDISGGSLDKKMFETISNLKCPYILMHLRGSFETMHTLTDYENVALDVLKELSLKINELIALNVSDIIIDPGFGFSKTIEQNYELMKNLDVLSKISNRPVLAGISRKSMIWKSLDITADEALNGTTALNMYALQQGAKILRVHDVKEAKEVVNIFTAIK